MLMPMPIQRQSTLALTGEDWGALNRAISTLMRNRVYRKLAEIHTNHTYRMHGGGVEFVDDTHNLGSDSYEYETPPNRREVV